MKLKYAILTASFIGMAAANGATIAWGAAQTITGDADVLTNGDFSSALSAGAGATVNTVVFSGGADFWGNGNADGAAAYYGGAGTADLNTVLDTQNWHDGTGGVQTTSISGLTSGNTYQIQVFMTDSRAGTGNRPMTVANADGSGSVTGASTNPGTPTFFVGTFVADAATQGFQAFNTADAGGFLNAVSVRETAVAAVPEPSSTALLGLGGLALILRRRK